MLVDSLGPTIVLDHPVDLETVPRDNDETLLTLLHKDVVNVGTTDSRNVGYVVLGELRSLVLRSFE